MASLRDLALPSAEAEDANHNLNWDETIGSSNDVSSARPWDRPSLSSHAMAHGSCVYGIVSSPSSDWITWKTSFAAHKVCRVASNHDGSIIVASTFGGTVSLLRAKDGKVLATRRVCSSEKAQRPAEVTFVANANQYKAKDMLIILVPTSDQVTNDDNENAADSVNVILVSNIDGEGLNNDTNVAEAAKNMSINALKLDAPCNDFEALVGCFLNGASTIRFAAGQADGNVSIHDYNVETKQSVLVRNEIGDDSKPNTFLTSLGMKLQHCGNDATFLLLCGHSTEGTHSKMYWYDLVHLNMACSCNLPFLPPGKATRNRPNLLSFEPVASCSDSALAVAVAMKESVSTSNGFVEVIQVYAEETMGLTVLSHPHKVYQIPVTSSSPLEGIDLHSLNDAGPYSFRFLTNYGSSQGSVKCREFVTRNKHVQDGLVGKIRLLLEREEYDRADELLLASNDCTILSSDPFAVFHSSEVALRRLQRLLASPEKETIMERARDCLRRIIAGAVSSNNETGRERLLEAADSVMTWPINTVNQKPTIAEYSMALSAMVTAIETALQSCNVECGPQLTSKKKELEDRSSAMACVQSLLETDSNDIVLDVPFLDVQSPSDVFLVLMEDGYFSLAEKFCRSDWGRHLTPEICASSILAILPSQNPRAYAAVLREAILPRLTITHEAIPLIRAWACQCANTYDDDDGLGLDASIFLLETILEGMQQLKVQVHASYANFSPFVETKSKRPRQPSPRNTSLDTTTSSFSSEASTASETREANEGNRTISVTQHPFPTVLELGFLKGGAMKSKLRSIPSRRSGDSASFLEEEADDSDESVEIKLRHAKLLEEARELGLSRDAVSLRDYLKVGGTERVAKDLVRIHSFDASGHDERYLALTSKVKPFCDEAGVDYDQILVKYNADLCDSKRTSVQALVESSSLARCCFAPLVKCEITLAVLRVALLCGKAPPCLSQLSSDSIGWAAVDPSVKSEIEEATRLLVVDGIVRKYCGLGARELFRVDNPLHVVRLLDFVSRHLRMPSVLSDVFALCDAFTFLTREEACVLVLQRAVASGDEDLCVDLLRTVFSLNDTVAASIAKQVVMHCCQELEEATSMMGYGEEGFQYGSLRARALSACKVGCAIAEACRERFQGVVFSSLMHSSFGTLLRDLHRIQRLQEQHELFLPLSVFDTNCATLEASRLLLKPVVEAFREGNNEKTISLMTKARAACKILAGPNEDDSRSLWYAVVGEASSLLAFTSNDGLSIDFLAVAGVLDDVGEDDAVRAILSVALSLCQRASSDPSPGLGFDGETLHRMEDVIRASSLVHDYALIGCPEQMLEALVSLALLTETASEVVLKADEGFGEKLEILAENLSNEARARRHTSERHSRLTDRAGTKGLRVGKPLLHPSWYVGDGLLLSPRDALSWSVAYCSDMLSVWLRGESYPVGMDGAAGLRRFLGDRGAHAAALRTSSVYTSILLSSRVLSNASLGDDFVQQQRETVKALCERSLGGSGTGITSMTIDSQFAVCFLLSLPLKVAFKVYRASLPTAITKRDFHRVITLANIGVESGDGHFGWKNQDVFLSQCLRLSSRAKWWNVLKFYQVDFDPSRFEEKGSVQDKDSSRQMSASAYAASLVPELISKASLVHKSTDLVRTIATKFLESFGLEPILAAQKHIEYVLSPPPLHREDIDPSRIPETRSHDSGRMVSCSDIRLDLDLCERAARDSLRLITSPMKRSAVLRRCVTSLERAVDCDKDYERHALVLSLYHTDLSLVVAKDPNIRDLDASAFEEELEFIERRRDALEILSSFFQGDQSLHRPSFPKFFVPLPVPFSIDRANSEIRPCDILGSSDTGHATFDPLGPLQDFLSMHMDEAATKALAPLTIPLGLPHGSIHARCLIERFRRFKNGRAACPSFEHDVLPVLNRLKHPADQSRLSEWCATYYNDLDSQKLQCLDYGLRYAMAASSEVEKSLHFKSKGDDDDLAAYERSALDAVKRLSDMHSTLSDRHEVNNILSTATIGMPQQFSSVERMVRDLTDRLQEDFWKEESSPEKFVERLLVEASLLASDACLDQGTPFSISQFRHMASVVHQACKRISEQYSHVHPGEVSRTLARRWLIHGDELAPGTKRSGKSQPTEDVMDRSKVEVSVSVSADEDDTVDFVMDLNENNAVWSDDVGPALRQRSTMPTTVSREEEPSALQSDGSAREASELECTKVSLRVAFVMSFAEGYHKSPNGEPGDEENITSGKANANPSARPKKSRPGLLSRLSMKDSSTRNSVTSHAKELLRIVFAKSAETTADPTVSFLSSSGSSAVEASIETRKTLTFAMRYRALRTAAVLCPQVALDTVASEEGYLNTSKTDTDCTLVKCTYGAFVAKEIEEMGLPLPHSDLLQLSVMHFPSYARALWRHHRGGDIKGNQGRLLLLLLEMSLRDSPDYELADTLLSEMTKLQLPRTLLLGCECVAKSKVNAIGSPYASLNLNEGSSISNAIFTTANLVLSEAHRVLLSPDQAKQDLDKGFPTVKRIGSLVENFSDCEPGQRQLCQFINVLEDLISLNSEPFSSRLTEIALSAARCVSNVQIRREFIGKLGQLATRQKGKEMIVRDEGVGSSALSELLFKIDSSYYPSGVASIM